MSKRVLLMNSGGPDCASIAKRLDHDGFDVVSLFVDTMQDNREASAQAAKETAARYGVEHHTLTADFGMPTTTKPDSTTLAAPFLIPLLMGLGTTWASLRRIPEVYYGFRKVMREGWPDLARSFITTPHGHYYPEAHFPIHDMTRTEVLAWAGTDMVELAYTVSCNESEPCKACGKCIERAA